MPILRSPEMPLGVKLYRDAILEAFPKQGITGMDPERAEHFIKSQGLQLAEYVVIEESDLPILNDIVGKSGLLLSGQFEDRGLWPPELQLAICMKQSSTAKSRNPTKYVEGSPLSREATLVHELAHGSGNFGEYIHVPNDGIYTPRSGFLITVASPSYGIFLEEGFADMMRARYVSQYISAAQVISLAEKMYLEQPGLEDTLPVPISGNRVTPLPVKYFCVKEPENQPAIPSGEAPHAAYTLELLVRQKPELNDALIKSRGTVAGLREVAQILNTIQPGLYLVVQRASRTQDDFIKIKSRVIREIMGGYSQIIQGDQQLIDYWNAILGN